MREGGRPIVRHGAGPFTVRPVVRSARLKAVAAQSLVEYVRLAALCGLLRCKIAEDPKGNRRRRFGRDIGRGSSRREAPKVAATGLLFWYALPNLGPAADPHARRDV